MQRLKVQRHGVFRLIMDLLSAANLIKVSRCDVIYLFGFSRSEYLVAFDCSLILKGSIVVSHVKTKKKEKNVLSRCASKVYDST